MLDLWDIVTIPYGSSRIMATVCGVIPGWILCHTGNDILRVRPEDVAIFYT